MTRVHFLHTGGFFFQKWSPFKTWENRCRVLLFFFKGKKPRRHPHLSFISPHCQGGLGCGTFSRFLSKVQKKSGKSFFCLPERFPWRSRRAKKSLLSSRSSFFLGNRVCLKRPTAFNLFVKKRRKTTASSFPLKRVDFLSSLGDGWQRGKEREKERENAFLLLLSSDMHNSRSRHQVGYMARNSPSSSIFFWKRNCSICSGMQFRYTYTHCIDACQKRETRISSIFRQSKMKRWW